MMQVADLHCDTIREIWLSELRGQRKRLRDSSKEGDPMHVDLAKMRKGDYLLQNFALFVDMKMPAEMLRGKGVDLAEMMPGEAMKWKNSTPQTIDYVDPWFQLTEMVRVSLPWHRMHSRSCRPSSVQVDSLTLVHSP